MSTSPQFMINPETNALFLITRRNDTGSFTGYILHDYDFKKRQPGAFSKHWKKILQPLTSRYVLSTLVPGEYPMLMVAKNGNNLYLITGETGRDNYQGIRIGSKNGALVGHTSSLFSSIEPFNGSIEVFNT